MEQEVLGVSINTDQISIDALKHVVRLGLCMQGVEELRFWERLLCTQKWKQAVSDLLAVIADTADFLQDRFITLLDRSEVMKVWDKAVGIYDAATRWHRFFRYGAA